MTDVDYAPYINAISDSLEKWTGLKWVNINKAPTAFADIREKAYAKIKSESFYLVPPVIDPELELDQATLDHLTKALIIFIDIAFKFLEGNIEC